jgi:hypothetical protein
MTSLNCCVTSFPCLHGGKCNVAKQYSEQRFVCKCSNGYHGYRCESCSPGFKGINCDERIISCRGYNNGSAVSGYYTIFGGRKLNSTYTAFCDFSSNTTWTLVQSYSFENKDQFQSPFSVNNATKKKNAQLWKNYRLSKSKINYIMSDSTKWRFTCNYDSNGTVYIDYATGLTTELDIIHFNDAGCVKVQYINVRGWNCTNCTVYMMQFHDIPLHVRIESVMIMVLAVILCLILRAVLDIMVVTTQSIDVHLHCLPQHNSGWVGNVEPHFYHLVLFKQARF